jgi:dihydrofolate reductase
MARRLRYQVAASLDGFIAGPTGNYDWIVMDPAIDFDALYKEFDTVVMGRKTYTMMTAHGGNGAMPGVEVVVFSRTLTPMHGEGIRITRDNAARVVRALKKKAGRDIWLFGGGELFRSLLDAGLVDTVEVAVMPVMLGAGIPLLPPGANTKLVLADQKVLKRSGIVVLSYSAPRGRAVRIRYVRLARKPTQQRAARKRVAKK